MSLTLSRETLINCMHPLKDEDNSFSVRSVLELKQQSCDLIVTDPPYGFNTDDDPRTLAALYARMCEVLIEALKDDGQLILCLPDRSHIGRRSPSFTHKEIVTQQILAAAEKGGREVLAHSFAVPSRRDIFRFPYYWESERALRRAILHFRFRRGTNGA